MKKAPELFYEKRPSRLVFQKAILALGSLIRREDSSVNVPALKGEVVLYEVARLQL